MQMRGGAKPVSDPKEDELEHLDREQEDQKIRRLLQFSESDVPEPEANMTTPLDIPHLSEGRVLFSFIFLYFFKAETEIKN